MRSTICTRNTNQAIFGDLRASLHRPPSQQNWIDVLAYLKRLRAAGEGAISSLHMRYVTDMLDTNWHGFNRPIWSDDAMWRYLENDPTDPVGRLFRAVTIRHNAHGKRHVIRVLDSPFLSHLDHIRFEAFPETSAALTSVLESDHLRELEEVHLSNVALELEVCPEMLPNRTIERVTLHHCDVKGSTIFALCDLVRRAHTRELYIKPSYNLAREEIIALLSLPLERLTLLECGVTEEHLRAFDPDELPPILDLEPPGRATPRHLSDAHAPHSSQAPGEEAPFVILDATTLPFQQRSLRGQEVVMSRDFAMDILEQCLFEEVGFSFRGLLEQLCDANERHDFYIVR